MTRQETIEVISGIYNELVSKSEAVLSVNESTRLFGGPLDSVNMVSLIVEIEEQIGDKCGVTLIIADDQAMSQQHSPFRTIGTLADYIQRLMTEAAGA